MTNENIILAWKSEAFRSSLDQSKRVALPDNPAGLVELDDEALMGINGGTSTAFCAITIVVCIPASLNYCSPNGTLCGTCNWGTRACC